MIMNPVQRPPHRTQGPCVFHLLTSSCPTLSRPIRKMSVMCSGAAPANKGPLLGPNRMGQRSPAVQSTRNTVGGLEGTGD